MRIQIGALVYDVVEVAVEEHPEQVIDILAHGLIQVLRDNPRLTGG